MRLENKVAIVTGAAKGLGGEMAQTFAKEGAKVIAVDMAPLSYECANVEYYQLNVTDAEACKALFEYAKEKYGRIDILVNNAVDRRNLTSLAAATKRPTRVVGMHFFSPVPKMRLCEVIFGLLTAEDVLHQIKEVGEKLGKTMILSDDRPGFIVNRALLPMLNEACVIVGSFIGSVEDVDNGMKLGCNHPMGPLELADMIGLDILLNVMTILAGEYGNKYNPSLLLRKLVTAGFLGRKSGAGFYVYENGKKMGVNPNLTRVHAL